MGSQINSISLAFKNWKVQ